MNARTATKRIAGRAAARREARIREAEIAIRWALNAVRADLPTDVIRRGAEGLVDRT